MIYLLCNQPSLGGLYCRGIGSTRHARILLVAEYGHFVVSLVFGGILDSN